MGRTAIGFVMAAVAAVVVTPAAPASAVPTETIPVFQLSANDLDFIMDQIEISEAHAYAFETGDNNYSLLCADNADESGTCVRDEQLPHGLRTVDGSFNNLVNVDWGSSNELMPRLLPADFRDADLVDPPLPLGPPGGPTVSGQTSYEQTAPGDFVVDSQARVASNLIVDTTDNNPSALAALADNPNGELDPNTGEIYLPNRTADEELSAPVNMWFVFFGQFFDHGLDLVNKGGSGTILVPLRPDDPLYDSTPPNLRFMTLDRATNQPGPDGVVGTPDDIREHENRTTPFVDQNQTYTSHPSHHVFIREYELVDGQPQATGKLLNGADFDGDGERDGLATWNDVKTQAHDILGIDLNDLDVLNVPQVYVDYYGNFIPGPNGFPQLMQTGANAGMQEGNLTTPIDTSTAVDLDQSFLDDIAHGSVPQESNDPELCPDGPPCLAGYDNVALGQHFITGDGRGNENIGLTAVHHVFHSEHNRMLGQIIDTLEDPANADVLERYQTTDEADDWAYTERLFQAARFGTEMQYQHLVFEEFARTVSPSVDGVVFNENAYDVTDDPSIVAEFAHVVYRFGHSMLTQDLERSGFGTESASLLDGFLNPVAFGCAVAPDVNNECPAGQEIHPEQAAGALVNGTTDQAANQIDELITSTLRNNLLGLPLDLATINLIRGRDVGVPSLNSARRTFFGATQDPNLAPYTSWFDYDIDLRNGNNFGRSDAEQGSASLVNFIAAYGTHPTILEAETL
ncbi:peroxidase family protein, partial [Ilumatobacter sp.]|uniref:peroxidase family protein n=1 Tax=Ilumatobacter sp. TaxID=1967498 RepID=UPI003C5C158D